MCHRLRAMSRDLIPSRGLCLCGRAHAIEAAEDRPGDHETLDLARPLVDLRDLGVAVVALDRELLGVAVAAQNLDRLRRLPARHLRREQLRLRALLRVPRA